MAKYILSVDVPKEHSEFVLDTLISAVDSFVEEGMMSSDDYNITTAE